VKEIVVAEFLEYVKKIKIVARMELYAVSSENVKSRRMIGCSKELINQFEKMLQISSDTTTSSSKSTRKSISQMSPKGIVKRRKRGQQPRLRKSFSLRPSKLNVLPVKQQPQPQQADNAENNFSFDICSKELESIIQKSSESRSGSSNSIIRPRSSSMPSSYTSSNQQSTKEQQACVTFTKRKGENRVRRSDKKVTSKEKNGVKRRNQDQSSSSSSCAQQARRNEDVSQDIDRLTDYLEESILLPKKMSYMAEMMYT
jgi:hypothetical protein